MCLETLWERLMVLLYGAVQDRDLCLMQKLFMDFPNLLDHGDYCSTRVELILLEAFKSEDDRVIKMLMKFLRSGSDENNIHKQLYIALSKGNVKLAELLLKNGANLNADSDSQMELYEKIFGRKNISTRKAVIELLSKYDQIDPKIHNEWNENILLLFTQMVNENDEDIFEIVELFLNAGVALDESNRSSVTWAVQRNSSKLLDFFISKGYDVNKKYDFMENKTLLCLASWLGYKDIVDLLLKNKAEVGAKNINGQTALHLACSDNDSEIVSLLLQYGAEISVEDNEGKTPFSYIDREDGNYEISVVAMVKQFAKMAFQNIPVSPKDMNSVLNNPLAREHFHKCLKELEQMSSMKFYPPYTYHSVVKMSTNSKKLSKLTKNQEFERNFQDNFSFEIYEKDLQDVFVSALEIRNETVMIESRLLLAFGSLLPDVVMRKLVSNLTVEDLPII